VCGECTTKVDGINYCVSCLAKLAGPAKRESAAPEEASPAVAVVWLVVGASGLTLLTWAMIELGSLW
jgi:hypothetical protein